ncbi:MAG: sodium-dependent transporter [Tissierellia bacterium]|nr:sodium-dependent transporter [Tissierellia bacterium]
MSQKDGFNSKFGLIAAAVGSAVGLGNIWRFPYMVGTYGGGAFLIVYLILVSIIGTPILMSELVIGRLGRRDAINSFKVMAPEKKWYFSGVFALLSAFLIFGFYCVVAGWTLEYLFQAIGNNFAGKSPDQLGEMFTGFITHPWKPILFSILFLAITTFVVSFGVQKGIEKVSTLLIPLLFVIIIILDIRALTLPTMEGAQGAMAGLSFLFKPDWSLINSESILAAMGHSFFTLSVGAAVLPTYGSYMKADQNIPSTSVQIFIFDLLIAIMAGIAIFPSMFAFGMAPDQGPGLVFIILPNVFASMPGGYIFGVLFFLLLALAALTSTISLLEVVVAYLVDSKDMERKKASLLAAFGVACIAVVASLSNGAWSHITIMDKNIFDFLDFITANYGMTLAVMIEVLFLGWGYSKDKLYNSMTNDGTAATGVFSLYYFLIRFIAPIAIIIIFLHSIGLF